MNKLAPVLSGLNHGYDWNNYTPMGSSVDQALTPTTIHDLGGAPDLSSPTMSALFEPDTLGFGASGIASAVTPAQDFASHFSNESNTLFLAANAAAAASLGNAGSQSQGRGSGGTHPPSYTSGTPGAFQIIVKFDASVAKAPSGFVTDIEHVADFLTSYFSNPTTIKIDVGFGEIDGSKLSSGDLGESEANYVTVPGFTASAQYSALVNAYKTHDAGISLPTTDPVPGDQQWWVTTAEAKALGLSGPSSKIDGWAGFSSAPYAYDPAHVGPNQYDFVGTALHEFTEVMGRVTLNGAIYSGYPLPEYTPLDLFHFSGPGAHVFSGTTPGYFSINNGRTDLKNFSTDPNTDFSDWQPSGRSDAFDASGGQGSASPFSHADYLALEAVGWKGTGFPGTGYTAHRG